MVRHECKYPNETLFEYVNNLYYNLPVQYNLSHYHAKLYKLQQYGLTPNDILIFHFNETKYKHLDIIKNPIDENGDNWLDIIQRDKKYEVKKLPILHYKTTVYDRYQPEIELLLKGLTKEKAKAISPSPSKKDEITQTQYSSKKDEITQTQYSSKKDEIRPISPLQIKSKSLSKSSTKSKSSSNKSSNKSSTKSSNKSSSKKSKCPKGTRRNKKSGNCEPYVKQPRCPKGTRRNKKTGKCESK